MRGPAGFLPAGFRAILSMRWGNGRMAGLGVPQFVAVAGGILHPI